MSEPINLIEHTETTETTKTSEPAEPTPAPWPAALDRLRVPILQRHPLVETEWDEDRADHTGAPVVTVFRGTEFIPSPIAFQVYVTYDTSHLSREGRVGLAQELYNEIAPAHVSRPVRLDVTFLEPVVGGSGAHGAETGDAEASDAETSSTVTISGDDWQQEQQEQHEQQQKRQRAEYVRLCIKHYLSVWSWQKNYTSSGTRMVRSYAREGEDGYLMFFITVPVPDWKERDALGMIYFGHVKTRKRKRDQDGEETQVKKKVPDPWYVWPAGLQAEMMGGEREGFVKRRLVALRDGIQGVVWRSESKKNGEEDMEDWLWRYHQIEAKFFQERWRKVYPTMGKARVKHKNRDDARKRP